MVRTCTSATVSKFCAPIMKPPAARTRMDGAPSIGRHELIGTSAVDGGDAGRERAPPVGTEPPMFPPTTPGASCATWDARRPLNGVSAICSARTVRPIAEVSTSVVAASTEIVSDSAPTSSETSTLMLTPALSCTSDFVIGLKPDSIAVIWYCPDRHVREGVQAGLIGHRLAFDLGANVHEGDIDAGEHCPGSVLDNTGDLGRIELCMGGSGGEQDGNIRGGNEAPIHSSSSHQGPTNAD